MLRRENERQLALMEQLLAAGSPGADVDLADEEFPRFAFTRARLTYAEAVELVRRIDEVADEMRANREKRARDHRSRDQDDLLEYSFAWSFLPVEPEEFAARVRGMTRPPGVE